MSTGKRAAAIPRHCRGWTCRASRPPGSALRGDSLGIATAIWSVRCWNLIERAAGRFRRRRCYSMTAMTRRHLLAAVEGALVRGTLEACYQTTDETLTASVASKGLIY